MCSRGKAWAKCDTYKGYTSSQTQLGYKHKLGTMQQGGPLTLGDLTFALKHTGPAPPWSLSGYCGTLTEASQLALTHSRLRGAPLGLWSCFPRLTHLLIRLLERGVGSEAGLEGGVGSEAGYIRIAVFGVEDYEMHTCVPTMT